VAGKCKNNCSYRGICVEQKVAKGSKSLLSVSLETETETDTSDSISKPRGTSKGVDGAGDEADDGGVCYCQPGYFGADCSLKAQRKSGNMRLTLALALAVAVVLVGFVLVFWSLQVQAAASYQKERDMGYAV